MTELGWEADDFPGIQRLEFASVIRVSVPYFISAP
jgi:hypothetical protein